MAKRKYTLPRHTVLARQGSRIGAFLMDLVILIVSVSAFFALIFNNVFFSTRAPYQANLQQEQLNSNLRHKDENGKMYQLSSKPTFEEVRNVTAYYYLTYLTGEDRYDVTGIESLGSYHEDANKDIVVDGVAMAKKDYYTVEWFNKTILGMDNDPDNNINMKFTYQKNNDQYDFTKLGVIKGTTEAAIADANHDIQQQYMIAYNHFCNLDNILELTNKINFIYSLEFVLSSLCGITLTYIVFPLIFKNGRTLGKKMFGLGLANSDGYKFNDKQLLMRAMPAAVVTLSLLIPVWTDIFIIFLMMLIIFLVSFALAMASPKKTSLHDFTARTIVIDFHQSIIFNNEMEEEVYLDQEEGIKSEEKD